MLYIIMFKTNLSNCDVSTTVVEVLGLHNIGLDTEPFTSYMYIQRDLAIIGGIGKFSNSN